MAPGVLCCRTGTKWRWTNDSFSSSGSRWSRTEVRDMHVVVFKDPFLIASRAGHSWRWWFVDKITLTRLSQHTQARIHVYMHTWHMHVNVFHLCVEIIKWELKSSALRHEQDFEGRVNYSKDRRFSPLFLCCRVQVRNWSFLWEW